MIDQSLDPRVKFLQTKMRKTIILSAALLTIIYFIVITFMFVPSSWTLFGFLIFGEIFHTFQILTFLFTVWNTEYMPSKKDDAFAEEVDVFITVAGEPVDIVEETVRAAVAMEYPRFKVHILNDGFVAKKDNWQDIEALAKKYNIGCITRQIPGGAKAGNINNALRNTSSPYIAIFDADHVPHADFLKKTLTYFADERVGYVQSPQYYKNHHLNYVTESAWDQQELFFGPICKGKNRLNSATMCGTNMVIARQALAEVGGMSEDSIAEDFLTGMLIHEKKWKSVYVPEVLAEGLAPEDFLSYSKQQFRWARGALDVIFKYNLLFRRRGLSFWQRLQYLSSVSFFLSGVIVVIDAVIPLVFFFTGQVPILSSTMLLATAFLPYIFLTMYVLQRSTNFSFTFRSLAFSNAGWTIHLKALFATILNRKSTFQITPKRQVSGNFVSLVIPQILYCLVVAVGIGYAFLREGLSASLVTNAAWALLNVGIFIPFILAALPQRAKSMPADISEGEHKYEYEDEGVPQTALRPQFRYFAALVAMLAFVTTISYLFFSKQSLRLDEAQSLWQVGHTPFKILNLISQDVHVPLYHFLLYTWQYFLGNAVAVGRDFSMIFFGLSILVIYAVGKRAYNKNVGIFSALLLAISPFMNWYGNEIRMYSAFVFVVLVSQYFFITLFKNPQPKIWIGYVIAALAGVYTHYFFTLFLLCQMIFYFSHRGLFTKDALKKFCVSWGIIAVAFMPWVIYVVEQGAARSTQPGLIIPSTVDLFNVFSQFFFGFQVDHINTLLVSIWPVTVLLVFLFLRKARKESPETSYFLLTLIVPNVIAFLISITFQPVFLSRYLIFSAPSMYILLSWMISTYPKPLRYLSRFALVSLILFALTVEIGSAQTPVKENYEAATVYLEANATPEDVIAVSAPFTIYPFEYYYHGTTQVSTLPIWDRSVYGPIPPFVEAKLPNEAKELVGSHQRLWLLLSYDQGYQEKIRQYFDSHYQLLWKGQFSAGVSLYEYKLRYDEVP